MMINHQNWGILSSDRLTYAFHVISIYRGVPAAQGPQNGKVSKAFETFLGGGNKCQPPDLQGRKNNNHPSYNNETYNVTICNTSQSYDNETYDVRRCNTFDHTSLPCRVQEVVHFLNDQSVYS